MSDWISVRERVPVGMKRFVQVRLRDGSEWRGYWDPEYKWWIVGIMDETKNVCDWRELPELPGEGT